MFCHALNAFVLSAAGSGCFAVGAARGKLVKRSAPEGPAVGRVAEAAGCGLCHVPGFVLLGGGGYAEAAWYGLPLGALPAVAAPLRFGYSPALRLSASYFVFCA